VFASIPRDVVFFPRAPRNRVGGLGSTSGVERVNTMYRDDYKRRPAPAAVDRQALLRFKDDVAFALDVEIDRYAYIRFSGFDAMIDGIGGLRVDVDASVFDDVYSDRAGYRGIYIPAGRDYRLGGWSNVENCRPYPMRCHRAIVFVRSRKGREGNGGNSDYRRIRRQQELVFSAISKVSRFDDPTLLALLPLGEQHVTTDLWQKGDTETVRLLRDALGGAVAGRRVVFGPSRYASSGGDLPLYSSVLRLSAVRGWIERHMTTADD
jgi:anionic cell wall polymer biosynthesis LytR-Cps2A-Psr (LCP) family protein